MVNLVRSQYKVIPDIFCCGSSRREEKKKTAARHSYYQVRMFIVPLFTIFFIAEAVGPARLPIEPPSHVIEGGIIQSVTPREFFLILVPPPSVSASIFREPIFKSRVQDTFVGKLVTLDDPSLSEGVQPRHLPHPSTREARPIDALESVGLKSLQCFVLGIIYHGVEDLQHVFRYRPNHSSVHLYQVLSGEPVMLQVSERPIALPEASFEDLQMSGNRWFVGEMPAEHF